MPGPEATIYWAALRLALEDHIALLIQAGFSPEQSLDEMEREYLERAGMAARDFGRSIPMPEPDEPPVEVNDRVVVCDGPAKCMEGAVIEIRDKIYAVVLLDDGDLLTMERSKLKRVLT
jgi:hypothetical protein